MSFLEKANTSIRPDVQGATHSVDSNMLLVRRLNMSRSIETVLIVLLLAPRAAAHNRMSGHVTQIDTASIWLRARFRPGVPFTITQATMLYCGHERISSFSEWVTP
jgi:hypothetical protein